MSIGTKEWLGSTAVWRRLRASPLYEAYLWIWRRDLLRQRRQEVAFYSQVLQKFSHGDLILDIGANEGHKAAVFLAMGAKVVCVEPDLRNIAHLRNRFRWRRSVSIVPKAVSSKMGRRTFTVFEDGSPLNTLSSKWVATLGDPAKSRFSAQYKAQHTYDVETTTLDQILADVGSAFYVKIDVEGHEAEVLEGLTTKVNYVSFELNLPEFRPEGLNCVEHLKRIDPRVRFNWAIETKLESEVWVGAEEFSRWLQDTQLRYMEVYAIFD